MPKNPFYADKVILKNGGVIETEDGTDIVAVSNAGAVTLTGTETIVTSEIQDLAVTTAKLNTDAVTNAKLADDAVSLENLDSGIEPSHVVKFAGTVTWSGAGASLAHAVVGALDTDVVSAVLRVKGTEPSYLVSAIPSADTVTFTVDAANTANDTQVDYVVFRAAA